MEWIELSAAAEKKRWQDKNRDQWLRQWDNHLLDYCGPSAAAAAAGVDLTGVFPHYEQDGVRGWRGDVTTVTHGWRDAAANIKSTRMHCECDKRAHRGET